MRIMRMNRGILLGMSVPGKFHLLWQSIHLEVLQIDDSLFVGQQPLENLLTGRPELSIDLAHVFNR